MTEDPRLTRHIAGAYNEGHQDAKRGVDRSETAFGIGPSEVQAAYRKGLADGRAEKDS